MGPWGVQAIQIWGKIGTKLGGRGSDQPDRPKGVMSNFGDAKKDSSRVTARGPQESWKAKEPKPYGEKGVTESLLRGRGTPPKTSAFLSTTENN